MQETEKTDTDGAESEQLLLIRQNFQKFEQTIAEVLPKVDRALIIDFLSRERVADGQSLPYTLEVFTKPGLDTEQARQYIYDRTGMMPAISDEGTHYITNQMLTLEILKEISDSPDVVEMTGDYTGEIYLPSLHGKR